MVLTTNSKYWRTFAVTPCEYVCDANTIALYHCDTGAGAILVDSCGAFNANFRALGSPAWTIDYKCPTHAIHFDGIIDYITQATLLDTFPPNGTIELWFKPDVTIDATNPKDYQLFCKANAATEILHFWFVGGTGRLNFQLTVGGANHTISSITNSWLANTWYHVACTWGATGMKIWVGAVNESSDPFAGIPGPGTWFDLYIGRHPAPTNWFDGIMDEIRFSNVQRTTFNL